MGNKDVLYLGKRSVYNAGNSKNISVPRAVLKELEKENDSIAEADVFYNKKTKELTIRF